MVRKNEIVICGKTYKVTLVDGVALIDGKTIDEFMDTLDTATLLELSAIGRAMNENGVGSAGEAFVSVMDKFIRNN